MESNFDGNGARYFGIAAITESISGNESPNAPLGLGDGRLDTLLQSTEPSIPLET